jgi:hypothetical protein
MTDSDTQILEPTPPPLIAPVWHTVVIVAVLLALSILGAGSKRPGLVTHTHNPQRYLLTILIEWLFVLFIWYGLRLRGFRLSQLIGGDRFTFLTVIRDLGIGILFLICSNIILVILAHLFSAAPNQAIRNILPSGRAEILVYLFLSLTAGICEEIVCRGYLQTQFAALTKSVWAGLAIQGVIFGMAHGYQGVKFMIIIAVYGCLFGLLAKWRRSLRPGMVGHALQDGLVGLLARHLQR